MKLDDNIYQVGVISFVGPFFLVSINISFDGIFTLFTQFYATQSKLTSSSLKHTVNTAAFDVELLLKKVIVGEYCCFSYFSVT